MLAISIVNSFTAGVYIYMQYVSIPDVFLVAAQFGWISAHGKRFRRPLCTLGFCEVCDCEDSKAGTFARKHSRRNETLFYEDLDDFLLDLWTLVVSK